MQSKNIKLGIHLLFFYFNHLGKCSDNTGFKMHTADPNTIKPVSLKCAPFGNHINISVYFARLFWHGDPFLAIRKKNTKRHKVDKAIKNSITSEDNARFFDL